MIELFTLLDYEESNIAFNILKRYAKGIWPHCETIINKGGGGTALPLPQYMLRGGRLYYLENYHLPM